MYNQQGLNLFGKPGVSILSNWGFIIVVTLLVMLVMTYLFQYSGFGYNRRAIQGNQKLAHDAGINIYKNAFPVSYTHLLAELVHNIGRAFPLNDVKVVIFFGHCHPQGVQIDVYKRQRYDRRYAGICPRRSRSGHPGRQNRPC